MGYTTEFYGSVTVEPPLNAEEITFLRKFNETRRMKCRQGPYYVARGGDFGQADGPDVIDYNDPPDGQPSLWCHWISTEDGADIEWDGGEKFYAAAEWMQYIIDHFIGSDPQARSELPFLHGHVMNGEIEAQGEERDDRWLLSVRDNKVFVSQGGRTQYGDPTPVED